MLLFALAGESWGYTYMNGDAEISYVKYDSSADGKDLLKGRTLAQKYSMSYVASNLYYRSQQRYYNFKLGYEWLGFDTKGSNGEQGTDFNIHQSFSKIKYSGEIGYNVSDIPVRLRAYINDDQPTTFKSNLTSYPQLAATTLIAPTRLAGDQLTTDSLIYNIEGRGKSISSGVFMTFDPEMSRNGSLYGLPRVLLDYRETLNKSTEGFNKIDNRTRELAVAGLNKENNWLQFRSVNFENFLDPLDRFEQQTLIIGLVDNLGVRKWASLTNWIEVSADGRLTTVRSPSADRQLEEYDANLMAIATRKTWMARSFLNYNRQIKDDILTETANVPVYVNGIYGSDTDWYASLGAARGRELFLSGKQYDTSYSNSITLGATTFKHSDFTLSPSMKLQTSRYFRGADAYSVETALETNSTSRFSNTLGLAGKVFFRSMDDGNNLNNSKTWSSNLDFSGKYRSDSKMSYNLQNSMELGKGSAYMNPARITVNGSATAIGVYYRDILAASALWTPSAPFSTSLDGSYDIIKSADTPFNTDMMLNYRASYDKNLTTYRLDSKFRRQDNGVDMATSSWKNSAEIQYRPDRYHDGLLRLTHNKETGVNIDNATLEALQRYSYNMFTRSGVLRNLATVSQEYYYASIQGFGGKSNSQYLMFSGRYSPTDRLSLYGYVKSQYTSPGTLTMYYNAGMNADFKLLSTSLDYTYAKRESDSRIEKKLAATVRRTF